MKLIFATHNQHKLEEIQQLITPAVELVNLNDLNFLEEIEETGTNLTENALIKAQTIFRKFQTNTFADDTGLEIEFLNGEPGVYSARYAGESKDSQANMDKVLTLLEKINNRKARFRTVIHLVLNGNEEQFEGIVEGEITREKKGKTGFGYDPVFQPSGYDKTFAEMGFSEKNKISHRSRAVKKLVDYLQKLNDK